MNATTAGRQSIGSTLFGYVAIHVPTILVVGPTLLSVVGSTVLFSGLGFMNHANVRVPFGRATRWLSGPQLHRMHHGARRRYHDSNYAAFFPFLDRMFGTLLLPLPDEWARSGVEHDVRPLFVSVFWPWGRPKPGGTARSAALSGADAPG
jgi:sterol desaturase/sphingolipid hydroxylase (fatty acid hydroxylase superfamily)